MASGKATVTKQRFIAVFITAVCMPDTDRASALWFAVGWSTISQFEARTETFLANEKTLVMWPVAPLRADALPEEPVA